MIYVLGAALPDVDSASLRLVCQKWEKYLEPRLAAAQMEHIKRFQPRGNALRARASRGLARLLALSLAPENAFLDMDNAGRPVFAGVSDSCVGFSHSPDAAFCVVWNSAGQYGSLIKAAIDAECPELADYQALEGYFRKFLPARLNGKYGRERSAQAWTVYEACFKLFAREPDQIIRLALEAVRKSGDGRAGSLAFEGQCVSWRLAPFYSHWLCIAVCGGVFPSFSLRWLHYSSLRLL